MRSQITREQSRNIANLAMTAVFLVNLVEVIVIGLTLQRPFLVKLAVSLMVVFGNIICSTMILVRVFALIRSGDVPCPDVLERDR